MASSSSGALYADAEALSHAYEEQRARSNVSSSSLKYKAVLHRVDFILFTLFITLIVKSFDDAVSQSRLWQMVVISFSATIAVLALLSAYLDYLGPITYAWSPRWARIWMHIISLATAVLAGLTVHYITAAISGLYADSPLFEYEKAAVVVVMVVAFFYFLYYVAEGGSGDNND